MTPAESGRETADVWEQWSSAAGGAAEGQGNWGRTRDERLLRWRHR